MSSNKASPFIRAFVRAIRALLSTRQNYYEHMTDQLVDFQTWLLLFASCLNGQGQKAPSRPGSLQLQGPWSRSSTPDYRTTYHLSARWTPYFHTPTVHIRPYFSSESKLYQHYTRPWRPWSHLQDQILWWYSPHSRAGQRASAGYCLSWRWHTSIRHGVTRAHCPSHWCKEAIYSFGESFILFSTCISHFCFFHRHFLFLHGFHTSTSISKKSCGSRDVGMQ